MHHSQLKAQMEQKNQFTYMGHPVEVVQFDREKSTVAGRVNGELKRAAVPNSQIRWRG